MTIVICIGEHYSDKKIVVMEVQHTTCCYYSNEPSSISSQNNLGSEHVYRKTSGYTVMIESTKLGLMCFGIVSEKPLDNCISTSELC